MAEKQDIAMNQFQVATDAEYIYAEATNGSQVKIKKSDLASALKGYLGIIEQKAIAGTVGNKWYRIMEFESGYNAIFILSLCTYINQPQLLIAGCVLSYEVNRRQTDFNKLAGGTIENEFSAGIKYKFENNKLVIWSKGSSANRSYIYMLSGEASAYPMTEETPPDDAITPTY